MAWERMCSYCQKQYKTRKETLGKLDKIMAQEKQWFWLSLANAGKYYMAFDVDLLTLWIEEKLPPRIEGWYCMKIETDTQIVPSEIAGGKPKPKTNIVPTFLSDDQYCEYNSWFRAEDIRMVSTPNKMMKIALGELLKKKFAKDKSMYIETPTPEKSPIELP